MINAIINGILKVINTLISVILAPIDALFANFFPDLSMYINIFESFVDKYIGGGIAYFTSMLPSNFVNLLSIFLLSVASYYTIRFTYNGVLRIWRVIKTLKFW